MGFPGVTVTLVLCSTVYSVVFLFFLNMATPIAMPAITMNVKTTALATTVVMGSLLSAALAEA